MMPWEKESAKKHFLTYIAGVLYHCGLFAALFYIFSLMVPFALSPDLISILRVLIAVGIFCGLGLLVKRIYLKYMKTLSCLDDYVANILVDLVLILAFVVTFEKNMRSILFLATIILFLYIPLGKIRHCLFFFYTRVLFGIFFGRRGVFPHKSISKA